MSVVNERMAAKNITVAKFGGTSVADYHAMLRCAEIIKNHSENRVVVVSASAGVTNNLVRLSQENVADKERSGLIADIARIQFSITQRLANPSLDQEINALLTALKVCAKRQAAHFSLQNSDKILSFGEQFSSRIFTYLLQTIGVNGHYFDVRQVMKTDALYGKAQVNIEALATHAKAELLPLINEKVVVTQGFIGSDLQDNTTTLGRGGSDYSAALLAEAIGADNLNIWTDVVGIFTTDPRITEQARSINEISFGEAAEMATFGAKILHPATLIPAMRQDIPVFVGSSKEPKAGGTRIQRQVNSNPTYRSIALRREQTLVTVKSPQMLHASGFLAKVFTVLAKHQLSVDLITTSEISVALTFDNPHGSTQALLTKAVVEELEQLCEVTVEHGLSLIAVIGNKIHGTKGVGSNIFDKVNDFNIRMICHGASDHNLCFLVPEDDANQVVERLHDTLFTE
ncbi:MAG: lysine-sensitive aspartokinase 3 [Cognaticolwellia sp.]